MHKFIRKAPFVAFSAVGDFRNLVHWCEEFPERTKAVQRVLKFVRGWDAAANHAKKAVTEDSWPRMFSTKSGVTLLYPCKHGKVDMTKIIGETARPDVVLRRLG